MKLKKHYAALVLLVLLVVSIGVNAKSLLVEELPGEPANSTVQVSEVPGEQVVEVASQEPKVPEIISYTVKAGDSLESIAGSYGIKVSSIAGSNNLSKDAVLKEGQQLKFPSIDGILHRIKNGETLWDIAKAYSVASEEIQRTNSMDSPDKLKIDQEIIIPGADKIKVVVEEKPVITSKKAASIKTPSRGGTTTSSALPDIAWPLRGKITSKFGPRWGRIHTGLDIAASTGTAIKAALDGKVVFSGWKGELGNLIIIDHGNGVETYYGHNSSNLVKVGQVVEKGQVIGKVGNTGKSTGPHLHFEVRKSDKAYNPLQVLR